MGKSAKLNTETNSAACGGAAIAFPLGKVARCCALVLRRDG